MAILGQRITVQGFIVSGLSGITAVLIWNMLLNGDEIWGVDGLVVGVVANFITFWIFKFKDASITDSSRASSIEAH
jgi:hypothetical protein